MKLNYTGRLTLLVGAYSFALALLLLGLAWLAVELTEPEHSPGYPLRSELDDIAILLVVAAVFTLLTMLIVRLLARRLAAPVLELTRRIEALDESQVRLEPLARDDEVGQLSRAFAALLERLQRFVRREQEFTRFASHELRSPATVIQGNLDLLRASIPDTELNRRILSRLDTASTRISQLVECFLLLSRESDSEALEAQLYTPEMLQRQVALVLEGVAAPERERVRLQIEAFSWRIHPLMLSILLDNLLRNALYHGNGEIGLSAGPDGIRVDNAVEQGSVEPGFGIGLQIVARICAASGWDYRRLETPGRFSVWVGPGDKPRHSSTQTSRSGSPKSS